MNKLTHISLIVGILLIAGAFFAAGGSAEPLPESGGNNVAIVEGKQVITIRAKGGYQPRTTVATAGVPTVLSITTNGTFDCSSALRIPSMGVSKNLPMSGVTDIDLGTPAAGVLKGVCAMGMYSFQIEFQE